MSLPEGGWTNEVAGCVFVVDNPASRTIRRVVEVRAFDIAVWEGDRPAGPYDIRDACRKAVARALELERSK